MRNSGSARVKDKSVRLALVLTLALGPFGLFYVNFWLPIALLVAVNVVGQLPHGARFAEFGVIALWPASVVSAYFIARKRHRAYLATPAQTLSVVPQPALPKKAPSEVARQVARSLLGACVVCAALAVLAVLLTGPRPRSFEIAVGLTWALGACLFARRAVLGRITSRVEWILQIGVAVWTLAFVIFLMKQHWP